MELHNLIDPYCGLVRYEAVQRRDLGDPEIFTVAAVIADIRKYGYDHEATSSGSGSGLTYEDAVGAAVGEAVERYALGITWPEDLLFGSYNSLSAKGLKPLDPENWPIFAPEIYAKSVPYLPFERNTHLAWISADSLTNRDEKYVPACMVYTPYTPSTNDEVILGPTITTGAACAPSASEALLKGVCELIERDAFMIVWRAMLACPEVEIDERAEFFDTFRACFCRPGITYKLFLTTQDLQIPSFVGVLTDRRGQRPAMLVGGAAHPNPNVAARKTILEMAQGLAWLDHKGGLDFPLVEGFTNVRSFENRLELYAYNEIASAFSFLDKEEVIPLSSLLSFDEGGLKKNLETVVGFLASRGLETLAVDLTSTEAEACGVTVVRVIVPGLETMEGDHLLPFLAGKRWREVPVLLGKRAPKDIKLNPFPHPYP